MWIKYTKYKNRLQFIMRILNPQRPSLFYPLVELKHVYASADTAHRCSLHSSCVSLVCFSPIIPFALLNIVASDVVQRHVYQWTSRISQFNNIAKNCEIKHNWKSLTLKRENKRENCFKSTTNWFQSLKWLKSIISQFSLYISNREVSISVHRKSLHIVWLEFFK